MKNMRIVVTRYGGPDAMSVIEEECPEPKPDEVRIRVLAAGVSLTDVMMREGIHPEKPVPPFTPGWDLVGTVDRAGARVHDLHQVSWSPQCPSLERMRSTFACAGTNCFPWPPAWIRPRR